MGGHATHDEAEARKTLPADLFVHWGKRDPIGQFEEYLVTEGVSREVLKQIESEVDAEVESAQSEALESRSRHMPVGESALTGVYANDPREAVT